MIWIYPFFEDPEILQIIFPIAYSSFQMGEYGQIGPSSAKIRTIKVDENVNIDCRFWVNSKDSPSILYFHGNGETAADYEWIAPLYNRAGINLFVADYRGYGSSGGIPTVSNMLKDAHVILSKFRMMIRDEGFKESIFLMGRSLGSLPAVELAYHHQDEIKGLIVESGSANNLRQLWGHIEDNEGQAFMKEDNIFLNKVKIRSVNRPTLIIHGEYDQILPLDEGRDLYQNSGAKDKKLLIIPGADHNDVMIVDQDLYFKTISEFVRTYA